jgi:flagellar FliJ protein
MTRSDRLGPVQQVLEHSEQVRAREFGEAQRRLAEAEAKLAELSSYHGEYLQAYRKRAEDGTRVNSLRDFQAFLARLEQALSQQENVVAQAREAVQSRRSNWQGAARDVKAVESVVDRWRSAEARAADRREQKESDERAQQAALRAGGTSEAK